MAPLPDGERLAEKSDVSEKAVKGLRRGRGRCTGRTEKIKSVVVARLERSRHGVRVGLGRGPTDVGEVGGEERRVRKPSRSAGP